MPIIAGQITGSALSASLNYTLLSNIPAGIVSSSAQVSTVLPAGTLSSSGQVIVQNTTGIGALATTGSNVFNANQTITGSLFVSQNLIVFGSSSVSYVSQSTLNIGTNLITVNTQNPSIRFGGLAVIDSGSSPERSGSILFDSINDQWIFVHQNTAGGITSSVLLMGPPTFNNVGNETLLTQNRVLKGNGLEHITDSQITDNGITVSITNGLSVGTNLTASQADITTLRATSITASVSGALTGTLQTVAQPNITSVGTLTSLTVSGDLTVDTNTLYVDATNDRVGIGTASPLRKLHVAGDFILTDNAKGVLGLSTGAAQRILAQIDSSDNYQYANGLVSVLSSGNVGIGTTSPSQKLHVSGSGTLIGLIDSSGTYSILRLKNSARSSDIGTDSTGLYMDSGGSYPIMFYAGSSERMRLDASGNLGLGTTSVSTKLEIFSTAASGDRTVPHDVVTVSADGSLPYGGFGSGIVFKNRRYNLGVQIGARIRTVINYDGNPGDKNGDSLAFDTTPNTGSALTEAVRIRYDGNVGIGTTNPGARLHILNTTGGTTSPYLLIEGSTANNSNYPVIELKGGTLVDNYPRLILTNGGLATVWSSGYHSSTYPERASISMDATNYGIAFNTSTSGAATERARITTGGNFGLGVTPSAWVSTWRVMQFGGNSGNAGTVYANAGGTDGSIGIAQNWFWDGTNNKYITSSAASDYYQFGGTHVFRTAPSGTGGNNVTLTERARITSDGWLLVGKTAQDLATQGSGLLGTGRAYFTSNADDVVLINRLTNDGALVTFYQDTINEGTISVSGNTISYNAFAGSHWSQLEDGSKPEILRGTVMEALDELCEWPGEQNERLPKAKVSDTAGSKKVYGVFMAWDNDWTVTNDMLVTSLGAFVCRVAADVVVEQGDLLESNGDGTARVQADDVIRSSTIGKVTSTVKTHEYEDGTYCVPTVLYCG